MNVLMWIIVSIIIMKVAIWMITTVASFALLSIVFSFILVLFMIDFDGGTSLIIMILLIAGIMNRQRA